MYTRITITKSINFLVQIIQLTYRRTNNKDSVSHKEELRRGKRCIWLQGCLYNCTL